MIRSFAFSFCVALLISSTAFSQNTNSSSTKERPRTTTNINQSKAPAPKPVATDKAAEKPAISTGAPKPEEKKPAATPEQAPGAAGVLAAFNGLLDGIRHADVNAVTAVYWNSPRLVLFNNNGTVTKGWDQVRKNREASYPELKDVKLEVRDVSITMLGLSGAVVSCQWTQSQTYKGAPETASGRMTLVFKRVGTAWKAIHLHTSPDAPNPSSIPASEQIPKPASTPN